MKWIPWLGGLFSLFYSFLLFTWPIFYLTPIGWMMTLMMVVTGVSTLAELVTESDYRQIWQIIQSSLSILVGLFGLVFMRSFFFLEDQGFLIVIASWLLLSGILRLMTEIQIHHSGRPRHFIHYVVAIMVSLYGLVCIAGWAFGFSLVGQMVPAFFLILGLALIAIFYNMSQK